MSLDGRLEDWPTEVLAEQMKIISRLESGHDKAIEPLRGDNDCGYIKRLKAEFNRRAKQQKNNGHS